METILNNGMKIIRKDHPGEKNHLTVHENGSVTWLSFPMLDAEKSWLVNGFSTRLGGVSPGKTGFMNLGPTREKNQENVRENFRRMSAALGVSPESLVLSRQTHTVNVRKVTESDRGAGYSHERLYNDVDGMMTDVPGLTLVTFYADCVPLLIADPVHRAIAASHSGWRGTVHDMGGETLRQMEKEYGTDPAEVIACIGPSICQDCYEVSGDVIDQFREAYPEELWPALFREGRRAGQEQKYQLNLWEACRQNFLRAGIPALQISLPDICTCCNPDFLYSHRASKGEHGNLAAFLQIREM